MEGTYGVYFGDQLCGKLQIIRQGLYYKFICRCRLTGDVVCRLKLRFTEKEEDLGVVVPVDDGFGLNTQLPVKRFSGKPIKVCVAPRKEPTKGTFVPICPEEPFQYIERLKDAYLVKKDGQLGIELKAV